MSTVESHVESEKLWGDLPIARGAVIGSIIGFFVVGGLFAVVGMLCGATTSSALGLGAFAGIWGGPGFGAMMGAVVAAHPPELRH